jgi:F-box/leucine-rich repeat protein 4
MLDYYTGIDAILLTGIKKYPQALIREDDSKMVMGVIQKKLETVHFMPKIATSSEAIEDFLKNDLNKLIEDFERENNEEKVINELPDEVIFNIFTFLDLPTLFNCSKVCKKFHQISKDPLLYVELNLKFYWPIANSKLIRSLNQRCQLIRKLDLSSCGYFNSITPDDFITFLRTNGKTLTHLRVNSSKFMNSYCIQTIGFKCENLIELEMRNYMQMTSDREFMSLTLLRKLQKVDLSRTGIDSYAIITLIKNNPNLTHFTLSFNQNLAIDPICLQIAINCKNIRHIDFWKCHNLSSAGLRALSDCDKLEVVNFGWNLRAESHISDPFKALIVNNKNLRRMTLSSVRGICERDLENIATFCSNIEYLDLLGIVGMSSDAVLKILQQCSRLKIIDLSFSENLDDLTLFKWASEYNVCIKRS